MTAVCPFDRRLVDQTLVGTSEHRIDLKRSIPLHKPFSSTVSVEGGGQNEERKWMSKQTLEMKHRMKKRVKRVKGKNEVLL